MSKVKIVKRKEPWATFFLKLLALSLVMASTATFFLWRYDFGIDTSRDRCLAPYKFFAIDKHQQEVSVGDFVAYRAKRMTPYIEDGSTVIKKVVAMAGDHITVKDGQVSINGEFRFGGFHETGLLGKDVSDFDRDFTLEEGELYVHGWHPLSYDSRYWGAVESTQIIGKTHALF